MAPAWWLSLALLTAPVSGLDHFRADASGSVGDTDTGALTNGKHYYASNERDLHLFADDVVDRGGLIVAVAADPGYILAAWADADALILVDLDPAITDLHRIYAAFFRAADDIDGFLELWSADGIARARELIVSAGEAHGDADTLLAIYDEARPAIARRFADLDRRMAAGDQPWLLSDAALYTRVAEMVRSGRVYAFRGDLTRAGIVGDLGRWLDDAELDVSLLYLSNAEQYFMYKQDFRDNMLAVPLADESLVLRTLPGRPAGFEYIVQDGADFRSSSPRPAPSSGRRPSTSAPTVRAEPRPAAPSSTSPASSSASTRTRARGSGATPRRERRRSSQPPPPPQPRPSTASPSTPPERSSPSASTPSTASSAPGSSASTPTPPPPCRSSPARRERSRPGVPSTRSLGGSMSRGIRPI